MLTRANPAASPGGWAFAAFDARSHGWFSGPDHRRWLMEALLHAWVITSIPTLHVPARVWRAAFDEATPAATDLDAALPGDVRRIEVLAARLIARTDCHGRRIVIPAAWFVCRASKVGVIGEVYRAVVPREAILVDLRRLSGGESEVLVRAKMIRDVNVALNSRRNRLAVSIAGASTADVEQPLGDFPFQVTDRVAFETYMRQAQEQ